MTDRSWDLGAADAEEPESDAELSTPVTLGVIRSALRSQRRLWVGCAVIGGLLGLAAFVLLPQSATATTRVLLAQPSGADPALAMQTDLALVDTQQLAQRVISDLSLDLTPAQLLDDVTATATTPQVLTLTVAGPDQPSAVARADSLSSAYLTFRADQVTRQAEAVISSLQKRVSDLTARADRLNRKISALQGSSSSAAQARLAQLVTQRGDLVSQASQLSQTAQSDQLQVDGVVQASTVLDPATPDPGHHLRRLLLLVASGVVGGLTVGLALVLGRAVLSDRPRRRTEIAAAVEAPIIISVGRVRGRRAVAATALQQVAGRFDEEIVSAPTASGWAILSVDTERETSSVVTSMVDLLVARGKRVRVVDLTESGRLHKRWRETPPSEQSLVSVVRPSQIPRLDSQPPPLRSGSKGNVDIRRSRLGGPQASAKSLPMTLPLVQDVTLAVAEVDPALGAGPVGEWAGRAMFVLRSGAVSTERLRTSARLVRAAGLSVRCAALVGSDAADDSAGLFGDVESGDTEDSSRGAREH